jgi:gliding motility-associated-like protein
MSIHQRTTVKTTLLIFFLGLSYFGSSQYCTLPTSIKNSSLSYTQTSAPGATALTYRFYYKLIIVCGTVPSAFLDQLHLSDLKSSITKSTDWIFDSVKQVTAQVDPCVVLPVAPCSKIYYYHADENIFDLTKTYVAATTNCCRPFNVANLDLGSNFMDYSNPPPPTPPSPGQTNPPQQARCPDLANGPVSNGLVNYVVLAPPKVDVNSAPLFTSDDSIPNVCINEEFSHKITAVDADGDSIAYHFGKPQTYNIAGEPSMEINNIRGFSALDFISGYSQSQPAGPGLTLDPKTGLLTGKIPTAGIFDIAVSAVEFRAGMLLDSVTEDFYFSTYDCSKLPKPEAITEDGFKSCGGFTLSFPDYSIPQYPDALFNPTTVSWNFGDGDSTTDFSPTHTYADTGKYAIRLIVFPGYHCADTANTFALVYPYVNSTFTYTDSCSDRPTTFFNASTSTSGAITNSLWQIYNRKNLAFSSSDYNGVFNFTMAPQTYQVFLTVTNEKGCVSTDSQYVNIEVSPIPLSFHDTLLSRGATLQLKVDDGNYNVGGQYLWFPVYGLSDPFSPDPILTSTVDGTYRVTVTNKYGCVLNDSFTVKYYKGPFIYVPNAFTPNGDGKNDIFKPIYIGVSELKYFRVFNRYGQVVFETTQQLQGWDGNLHGDPAPEGAYVWEVSGRDYTGKWEVKSGSVVLLK